MNLYKIDVKLDVRGDGAGIDSRYTFHVSASSAQLALIRLIPKVRKYLRREYSYLLPFKKERFTVHALELLDERW